VESRDCGVVSEQCPCKKPVYLPGDHAIASKLAEKEEEQDIARLRSILMLVLGLTLKCTVCSSSRRVMMRSAVGGPDTMTSPREDLS